MILDVGAGPNSIADIQIDKVRFPRTTFVMDAMIESWPINDNSMDEVRMEQFLEHCPPSVRLISVLPPLEDGRTPIGYDIKYPRIHCMKEAYRVLKRGGILHVSVPGTYEAHCQDPTHEGPMITDGFFNYFCGEWGGGEPGSFVNDSYGINFKFKKIESYMTGFILTVRLQK